MFCVFSIPAFYPIMQMMSTKRVLDNVHRGGSDVRMTEVAGLVGWLQDILEENANLKNKGLKSRMAQRAKKRKELYRAPAWSTPTWLRPVTDKQCEELIVDEEE